MDIFTRAIRGWYLGRDLTANLMLAALERALAQRQPQIYHSDQGVQYAATGYVERLQQAGIQISIATRGCPTENAYAERVIRTLKEEEVELYEYRDLADPLSRLGRFLDEVYMHKRVHSALGYLPPAEFQANWRVQTAEATLAPLR